MNEDDLIDRALVHRKAEEPRPGLEDRVLARLEGAETSRTGWFVRVCAVAVPAAVVLALALYVLRDDPIPNAPPPAPEVVDAARPAPPPRPVTPPTEFEPVEQAVTVAAAEKPAEGLSPTFPAPAPLSPEEELFVRFVRNTPPATLQAVARPLPDAPLKIDKLSTPRLLLEPLPHPGPLSAS